MSKRFSKSTLIAFFSAIVVIIFIIVAGYITSKQSNPLSGFGISNSADGISVDEFFAEKKSLENQSGWLDGLTEKKSNRTISFVELNWRDLVKVDPKTLSLPNKYSFVQKIPIRIKGFITPLENDEVDSVSEFLFSPYIGSCIHIPPPPKNELILVLSDRPLPFQGLWAPVYLTGMLEVKFNSVESYDQSFQADSIFFMQNPKLTAAEM